MKVQFTAQAEADLEQIGDFIAKANPARALSFVRELRHCCLELGKFPLAFPIVPRLAQSGIRRRVHGSYLLFYQTTETEITVLHVLHGATDYDALLLNEPPPQS